MVLSLLEFLILMPIFHECMKLLPSYEYYIHVWIWIDYCMNVLEQYAQNLTVGMNNHCLRSSLFCICQHFLFHNNNAYFKYLLNLDRSKNDTTHLSSYNLHVCQSAYELSIYIYYKFTLRYWVGNKILQHHDIVRNAFFLINHVRIKFQYDSK